jgi:cysteine desulfuration protein SufE
MMQTINELQDAVIEEFSAFTDWMDRYALLIDMAGSMPELDEALKTETNLIEGCQSRVWLHADYTDGKIYFRGESDALIVKGIVALLVGVLSGHTPREIVDADLYFIDRIGLREHLSPTRSNGLVAMLKQMRMYALAILASREGRDGYDGSENKSNGEKQR